MLRDMRPELGLEAELGIGSMWNMHDEVIVLFGQ